MAYGFVNPHKGQQDKGAGQIKDGVGIGNTSGIDGFIPYGIQQSGPVNNGDHCHDQDGFAHIEQDIDNANPLCVRSGADAAHNSSGQAVPQVDAHQHGVDLPKSQLA